MDWSFNNSEIANKFDSHVREQLPWYELATGIVSHIARHFIQNGGLVYDVGASTGNISRAIEDTIQSRKAELICIESSEEMAGKFSGIGELVICDATEYDYKPFDLCVCFLVLMFINPSKRETFMNKLCQSMLPGGAIIVFDKIESCCGYVGTILHRLTMAGKLANGAIPADIIQKEMSLIGVQRPIGELSNIYIFDCEITKIFMFGEFSGYIITKPSKI